MLFAPTFKPLPEYPEHERSPDKVTLPVIVSPQETAIVVVVDVVVVVVLVVVVDEVVVVVAPIVQKLPDHPESHTQEPLMQLP
jgi:hypothetical protein